MDLFLLPNHEVCAWIVKQTMSQVDFYLAFPWGLSGPSADHTGGPITAFPIFSIFQIMSFLDVFATWLKIKKVIPDAICIGNF